MKGKKTHVITSTNTEKASDKTQHIFMIKTLNKLGIDVNNVYIIKVMDERPIANIVLNDEKLKAFL